MLASSCHATVQVRGTCDAGRATCRDGYAPGTEETEEITMRRTAGKTHTLYADVQWHKHANADCYRCGARERAQRMVWLEYPQARGHLALCPACATMYTADSALPPGIALATPELRRDARAAVS